MVNTPTPNLRLPNPTIGDAGWGTTENTARTMVDQGSVGIVTQPVGGASNVVLTTADNTFAGNNALNAHFVLTGVLTGNIVVLWPNGFQRNFTVLNSTTGAFTLACGVNNGSGLAAGTTVTVPRSLAAFLLSDGTNVTSRFNGFVGGLTVDTLTVVSALTLSAPLPVASGGTGLATLTAANLIVGNGASAPTFIAPGSANNVLLSNGSAWSSAAVPTGTSGAVIPLLNGNNTYSGTSTFSKNVVTTPQAASVTGATGVDLGTGNSFDLTLTGNITGLTPSNMTAGQSGRINLIYSGGNWTVTGLSAIWKFPGGTAPSFSSSTGLVDMLSYDVRDSTHIHAVLNKNFA